MYLGSFDPFGTQQAATNAQSQLTAMQYNSCVAAHGYWDGSQCHMPMQAAPAPSAPAVITVSVPTNVTTQVSPQISPNLIQQQQPTNSPISAGTASSPAQSLLPPQSPPTYAPDTSLMDYLAAQAAHDKAVKDAADAQQARQAAMPNSPAMSSQSVETMPVDNTTAPVQTASMPDTSRYMLYGVAALLGVTLIASRKQR